MERREGILPSFDDIPQISTFLHRTSSAFRALYLRDVQYIVVDAGVKLHTRSETLIIQLLKRYIPTSSSRDTPKTAISTAPHISKLPVFDPDHSQNPGIDARSRSCVLRTSACFGSPRSFKSLTRYLLRHSVLMPGWWHATSHHRYSK